MISDKLMVKMDFEDEWTESDISKEYDGNWNQVNNNYWDFILAAEQYAENYHNDHDPELTAHDIKYIVEVSDQNGTTKRFQISADYSIDYNAEEIK